MIGPDSSAHRPDTHIEKTDTVDSSSGVLNTSRDVTTPPSSETSESANPINPQYRGLRPFSSTHQPTRRRTPSLQLRYRRLVWKLVNRKEWTATIRNMLSISQSGDRQAVAAAGFIRDMTAGPVAQQIALDVTAGGENIEERRQRLYARAAEMGMPIINVSSRPADIPPQ